MSMDQDIDIRRQRQVFWDDSLRTVGERAPAPGVDEIWQTLFTSGFVGVSATACQKSILLVR